jgi:hypothetical protein
MICHICGDFLSKDDEEVMIDENIKPEHYICFACWDKC